MYLPCRAGAAECVRHLATSQWTSQLHVLVAYAKQGSQHRLAKFKYIVKTSYMHQLHLSIHSNTKYRLK